MVSAPARARPHCRLSPCCGTIGSRWSSVAATVAVELRRDHTTPVAASLPLPPPPRCYLLQLRLSSATGARRPGRGHACQCWASGRAAALLKRQRVARWDWPSAGARWDWHGPLSTPMTPSFPPCAQEQGVWGRRFNNKGE
jgi:hypothetical protein